MRFGFCILAVAVAIPGPAIARTWYVKADGTGDAPTIQAAIDSSTSGDEVLLAAGTYRPTSSPVDSTGMVSIHTSITLRGEMGAQATILDAEHRQRVISCTAYGVHIEDLTITHGRAQVASPHGGGIHVTGALAPVIADCIVRDNTALGRGGGIACEAGATIRDCEITGNVCLDDPADPGDLAGGGVYVLGGVVEKCLIRGNSVSGIALAARGGGIASGGQVVDCRIEDNYAGGEVGVFGGGVELLLGGSLLRSTVIGNRTGAPSFTVPEGGGVHVMGLGCSIRYCVILDNHAGTGGGIFVHGSASISGSTLAGNRAWEGLGAAGGIEVSTHPQSSAAVYTCILAWNVGVACRGATVSCSDVFGNTLGDAIPEGEDAGSNFSLDPQFCGVDPLTSHNFGLQQDSPCAAGNHPDGIACGTIGARAVGCGTVSIETRTWGGVKSLYRAPVR